MQRRISVIILFQLFFWGSAKSQTDTILSRYREYLSRTEAPKSDVSVNWARTLNPEGQWPDINYTDKEPAGWKISNHLVRIREMALAWTSTKSSVFHDPFIGEKINAAIDHWTAKRYQSSNWWHNEIGVPRLMRDIIILLEKDLEPKRLKQALEVMSQLIVHDDYTGGNLVWGADLGLHYGALTGDQKLINHCRNLIVKEIMISKGEGVQPDYSFHQHGKRLQMYQYGEAFVGESIRVAWQLRETPIAFPKQKIDILTDFILEGWQWMARGVNTVPGTMDRSASRKGELRSPDIRPLIPFMVELQPEKTVALKQMEAIQNGKGALNGYRYYPYSDFAVYHRPDFSFFLKTISNRTYATESINKENLKGKLLHSGDSYFIRNGNEYFDLMPVWDWTKLPGVTAFKGADLVDRKAFVGSVSDSTDGFSVMDYVLKDKAGKQEISARKFWACHKDVVISLIADLKSKGISDSIYTTLDQSRWQSNVTVNKKYNVLDSGSHTLENVKWIHHSGFAYIPLQPNSFNIQLKNVSGNWSSINASADPTQVHEKVFTPVMLHNLSSQNAAGYVTALCKSPKQAEKLSKKPSWKVLRNDRDCQAVQFKDGLTMAAFYSGTKLESKKIAIQTDQPCLIMLKDDTIYASDPTHKGINTTITINDKQFSIDLPKDGFTMVLKDVRNGNAK